ncbi:hypothetical protein ACE1SA_21875, partial [Yersinia intermedia]|uniref:hypothetical protein n=1 Tax=Yersinia intermedia TaxID=631 RepID=UPI0035C93C47
PLLLTHTFTCHGYEYRAPIFEGAYIGLAIPSTLLNCPSDKPARLVNTGLANISVPELYTTCPAELRI